MDADVMNSIEYKRMLNEWGELNMPNYYVINTSNIHAMILFASKLVKEGYQPVGSVSTYIPRNSTAQHYMQAMVYI